ncbi:MAG: protein disulfide oxidoreductase [Deltaproteobacteria bacterium]|nr:protein disulfide oxidoreductase [Deltaproteobacteria bacterium]
MDERSRQPPTQKPAVKAGPRTYRRWVVNLAVIAMLFFALRECNRQNLASGTAPPFEARSIDGRSVSLEQLRGEPLLLHFWASWCGVCSAMAGNIEAVARDYRVLTVASQSGEAQEVQAYVSEHGLSFPVLVDADGRLARRYGVHAFPTTFLIDKKAVIRYAEVGFTTEIGLRIRAYLSRH